MSFAFWQLFWWLVNARVPVHLSMLNPFLVSVSTNTSLTRSFSWHHIWSHVYIQGLLLSFRQRREWNETDRSALKGRKEPLNNARIKLTAERRIWRWKKWEFFFSYVTVIYKSIVKWLVSLPRFLLTSQQVCIQCMLPDGLHDFWGWDGGCSVAAIALIDLI